MTTFVLNFTDGKYEQSKNGPLSEAHTKEKFVCTIFHVGCLGLNTISYRKLSFVHYFIGDTKQINPIMYFIFYFRLVIKNNISNTITSNQITLCNTSHYVSVFSLFLMGI